ncbi:nucleolar protein 8 [Dendropsophus ebraccatus]|uniref:nucleolar protein 8 n=1 Tax=Dendropsophus ebraccatus TaxID=150705 RepID=UPI0038318E86
METTLRRLYVGGLSPSVTDVELSERFGRFGKVDEVDIISRKDDQGNPIKTFAYLNINISDTDLRKCLSLLNKTKWKGGVLQIEMAKESFLHKLEQERQAAKEKKKSKEQSRPQNDLLRSLEKAGVTDFQMKAAVPGTEVPNHKNWVVSKYGRVLPMLHIKGNKQSKIMKYDPSKYCHNLKKIDSVSSETTPITKLTWQLDGGDDDISKKRRGEFPEYKTQVKKSKVASYLNTSKSNEKGQSVRTPQTTLRKDKDTSETQQKRETFQERNQGYMGNKSINSMSDNEYDSEEELKAIIAREKMLQETGRHAEDNSIEVVDDSFTPRYNTHWAEEVRNHTSRDDKGYDSADTDEIITVAKTTQICNDSKEQKDKNSNVVSRGLNVSKSKDEFDSSKICFGPLYLSSAEEEQLIEVVEEALRESIDSEEGIGSADTDDLLTIAKTTQNCNNSKKEKDKNSNVVRTDPSIPKSKRQDDEAEEENQSNESDTEDGSDSYSDEEYESMMQNCYRMDLSLGDLEALVKEAGESDDSGGNDDSEQDVASADTDEDITEAVCVQSDSVREIKGANGDQTAKKKQKCKADPARDLGPGHCSNKKSSGSNSSHSEGEGGPMKQDLTVKKMKSVSKSSLNDDKTDDASEDEEARKDTKNNNNENAAVIGNRKRKKGIDPEDIVASILEDEDDDDDGSNHQRKRKKKKSPSILPPAFKGLGSLMASVSDSNEIKAMSPPTTSNKTKINHTEVKQDSKDNGERPSKTMKKTSADAQQRSEKNNESSSSSGSSSSSDDSSSDDESSSAPSPVTKPKVPTKEQPTSKAKQLQDNQKRLAAMEERRKEREQQKQAIQGALHKLDSQSAKKSHHIVFNSESESEKEEEASTSNVQSDSKPALIKAKLFDSSGEDSDDEEEKDDERFEIKAQYEGRSGEKLMQLQSRFGTDERFKMDARFIEDSSEDEEDTEQPQKLQADNEDDGLSAEKKRNLDILQSVLNINVEPQSTGKKAKAKKFKDLNALQYDPTKEDHAVFETKAEKEKKESKSKIKKKRLEAEKLPEVSKELFHEVTVDFKEVFSAPKPQASEEPEIPWDQMEKPQKIEAESSGADVDFSFQKKEEPAGFTFSFFGASTEESVPQDEPYKIETVKATKVAWQEDPRFQESSSEGEDEEKEDMEVNTSSQIEKSSIRFFFFVKEDIRLKEGPKMFFRSSKSEQKAKEWDYMRDTIMEKCKKRHKDAKRKLKSKH